MLESVLLKSAYSHQASFQTNNKRPFTDQVLQMDPYTTEPVESGQLQGFHAVMRFLRVVNRHRMILIGCVAAAAFLAVVRFNRLPKQYSSSTRLLVTQKESAGDSNNYRRSKVSPLASYKQLVLSDEVLAGTIKELGELPPEIRGITDETIRPVVLRGMLTLVDDAKEQTLQISCKSIDPESTVAVIEALRTASDVFMTKYQGDMSGELMERLEVNLQEVQGKLDIKEDELLSARRGSGEIMLSESKEAIHPLADTVSTLNSELTTIRSRRLELQATLSSAERLVQGNYDLTSAIQKLGEIVGEKVVADMPGATAMSAESIEGLSKDLQTFESELSARRPHFGSKHPEIIRRQSQINDLRVQIAQAESARRERLIVGIREPQIGRWLIEQIRGQLTTSLQFESSLQAEYDKAKAEAESLSDKLAGIKNVERETETLRNLHQSLLTRLNQIGIDRNGGGFRIASLSNPMIPRNASYPILSSIVSMFCFLGAAIGLGIIYVLDLVDDRLRSPEEVREQLGLSVLAVLRKLPDEEVKESRIYVHGFPQTIHSEAFRTLKTSLTLSAVDTKCIAVTSTEASEGKTTTTVNLAASYAQTGVRTLLIDADMRRPGLSRLLELRGNGGLSEVLRSEEDISAMCRDRVVSTEVPLLDVLPCGPRILNAGMLLSMPTLASLLDWAVSEYDQVIVDCPPTLPVSDAAIVGRYVDSMLFVMNPDKTHRRSVVRAVDQLRGLDLKIAGVVANTSMSDEKTGYGYQYGYGYGYASEYAYGSEDDEFAMEESSVVLADEAKKAA